MADNGSPRPARGERRVRRHGQHRRRITPARAGRARSSSPRLTSCADHPRPRGENDGADLGLAGPAGPPPPARGELNKAATPGPECADHPRPRKENAAAGCTGAAVIGPPPPARGEPLGLPLEERDLRTTPARAGRTLRYLGLCGGVIDLRSLSSWSLVKCHEAKPTLASLTSGSLTVTPFYPQTGWLITA